MGSSSSHHKTIRFKNFMHKCLFKPNDNDEVLRYFTNEALIKEITSKTKLTRDDIDKWYQNFMKDCPTGKLDKRTFINAYKGLFPGSSCKDYCEAAFSAYDKNKSGYIEFDEFITVLATMLSDNLKEKLELAFLIYDYNNDGVIEPKEAMKILKSLYKMHDDEQTSEEIKIKVNELFQRLDKDKNGVLTLQEFIDGCCENDDIRNFLQNVHP